MRKLYEINSDLESMLSAMALEMEENGEVSDATVAQLSQLQIEKNAKIEGLVLWYKNLNTRIEEAKAEKARIAKIQASGERELKWVESIIPPELAGQPFKTLNASVSYRTTHNNVDIEDPKAIPARFIKPGDPDKTAIKEALLAGKKVKGASLADHTSMIIK